MLNPIDFLALQEIHSSLEDTPGSNFLLAWDFSSDPCSFPGVLCNPTTNHVVSLSLGDPRAGAPGLTGKLHPSLSLLSELTDLSLVPGRVYGLIPPSLSLLRRLRFLALSENFLSGPIPQSLSSLPSLQTLDLSFNLLSGSIPPPPPSLSFLILSHNRLSGTIPSAIGGNPRLLRLDLKHNHFTAIGGIVREFVRLFLWTGSGRENLKFNVRWTHRNLAIVSSLASRSMVDFAYDDNGSPILTGLGDC
ncbi:probable inactive leucine-rich repeat receptor kinase XIAO [Dioscorea cayenensis subsp. rotundata]|uniref:Probable inactive leucine-rich repeat receptor kinase XIAO n=1 Tax=Dioscorea cayennensis subsp. rotundata TaxID=55577 RepID=A0AB40CUA8_DIOCR|nr:probable inactive leucine-rich repeat receptor kinase XIAO [Dioscorea cayenensis subsp. rotundata]